MICKDSDSGSTTNYQNTDSNHDGSSSPNERVTLSHIGTEPEQTGPYHAEQATAREQRAEDKRQKR